MHPGHALADCATLAHVIHDSFESWQNMLDFSFVLLKLQLLIPGSLHYFLVFLGLSFVALTIAFECNSSLKEFRSHFLFLHE